MAEKVAQLWIPLLIVSTTGMMVDERDAADVVTQLLQETCCSGNEQELDEGRCSMYSSMAEESSHREYHYRAPNAGQRRVNQHLDRLDRMHLEDTSRDNHSERKTQSAICFPSSNSQIFYPNQTAAHSRRGPATATDVGVPR